MGKLPKKRSPILEKVSSFMRISILMAKMRKPIKLNLIFMKKSARRVEKLKLLRHYNYGFIQEYQFSPSSTPLSFHNTKKLKERKKRLDMNSVLLLCSCWRRFGGEVREDGCSMAMEALPGIEDAMILSREIEVEEVVVSDSGGEDDGSVDERAERFIEKFYQQMRLQRLQSDNLLRGCSLVG